MPYKPIRKTESILQLTGDGIQLEEVIAAHYVPLPISPGDRCPHARRTDSSFHEKKVDSGPLALITLHGADDSRITFDTTWIDIELLDNGYGSLVIPEQLAKLYQSTWSVDGSILIKGAASYGKYFPKIAIFPLMDELTTPNPG
ncbi:hypothetical protein BGX34_002042, partial [Mortierella sp. NVP85]